MIDPKSFSAEYIHALSSKHNKDPFLVERMLFAFGLLEALVRVDMPFIFKGGTSLMLLLEHPRRLSTDIDIIVEPDTDIKTYIEKASEIFPFERYDEQIRKGQNNIVKRHFKFYYRSPAENDDFYIILDVLFEENHYASIVQREIKNEFLLTDEEQKLEVAVPSIDCILGDKLTAFAPHTTGILIDSGKELEIMKQLFDIAFLMAGCENLAAVQETYQAIAAQEIAYRGLDITYKDVLRDTIEAAICIIGRGSIVAKNDYPVYKKGITALSSHIFSGKYTGDMAAFQACKVFYLAACLLTDQNTMISVTDPDNYKDQKIPLKAYKKLDYIRKMDLEAYAYLWEGTRLLEKDTVSQAQTLTQWHAGNTESKTS